MDLRLEATAGLIACNKCRMQKMNVSCRRLASNASQTDMIQLKCNGDKDGWQRCCAICTDCIYRSNGDKVDAQA